MKICRSLVKELRKNLALRFRPSVGQLTSWLSCFHKSRQTQRKIRKDRKIGEDKCRVHANSQVQDVSNSTEFILISHLYTNLFLSNSTEFILISHLYTNLFLSNSTEFIPISHLYTNLFFGI